jgi:hypothetical protein
LRERKFTCLPVSFCQQLHFLLLRTSECFFVDCQPY